FDNVRIPKENILPNVEGLKGPLSCLDSARFGIAWGAIGAAIDCYESALKYSLQREQFGKPIASFQLQQKKLAEMITEITKAQLLAWRLGVLKNEGRATSAQISMAKRNSVEMALHVAREARQIHGGMGITGERLSSNGGMGAHLSFQKISSDEAQEFAVDSEAFLTYHFTPRCEEYSTYALLYSPVVIAEIFADYYDIRHTIISKGQQIEATWENGLAGRLSLLSPAETKAFSDLLTPLNPLDVANSNADRYHQQLGVAGQRHSTVREAVAKLLLRELPPATDEATPLNQLLPDAQTLKTLRYALRDQHGVVLPALSGPPIAPAKPSLWERLTGLRLPTVPHWSTQTVAELIDWTIAANYEKLLVRPLASQYEVEQAAIGLTSDKSGVPVEEIRLHHSFTNELGMD
nr:hypothetical protein [Tanacetum cinerariifolium]